MLKPADSERSAEKAMVARLRTIFCHHMSIDARQFSEDESFFALGLTSLIHHEVVTQLTCEFGNLSSTVLFEYPNLQLLAQHLLALGHKLDEKYCLNAQDEAVTQ